ncbi:interleukin-31 receptor subunit alpha isoform X2 [Mastacembelus armatus]|uniref:interleukin-31 receptor subunit alpha isoform X2 n=1 Tax=Mastacembelus armatus TaxID=205130 RepID=UPI000E45883B|nr:interleukin-31 receptor subunit alpha-like isoform X2 [Mastacembelus armatus]
MEWSPAMVWTCLLVTGFGLVLLPDLSISTSRAFPGPPRLTGCVFINRANVTCHWEAADTPTTHYTLQVWRMTGMLCRAVSLSTNHSQKMFTCTTSDTSCTAGMNGSSVRFTFGIIVIAHTRSQDISSEPRCQPGRLEVMLPPVMLNNIKPVDGSPQCLNVIWSRTLSIFPVSTSEIEAGNLNTQIQFAAQGQFRVQVKNVTVTSYSFRVCLFRPDTSYTIKLRHRYRGPQSPWSPWSNARQGRTREDAPSAAPVLWRQVKHQDKKGGRLTSLLWKTERGQILNDPGSCRDLHHASTSCTLLLPAGRCSCALTASNSAGTSPQARIWLLRAFETEPPSPNQITASPLDNSSLDVCWMLLDDQSVTGFVVEWFAVLEKNSSILYWERLNRSSTALVIAEGIKPMERYAVSVKALYGERGAGMDRTIHIYTLQGAPSAGPTVEVQQISSSTVELSWSPVAVELLHGFIRNYTLNYAEANQPVKSVFVPGHVHRYSLKNLAPGNYDIFIQANTDAGAGAAGPIANVHIDSEEFSIVMNAIVPLLLISLALMLMACLAQNKMVKQKLCQNVPNPSHSTLAHWTPKTILENMKMTVVPEKPEIKYSEVILLGESELQNCNPDQDTSYHSTCNLQTYSPHQYCPLSVLGSQTVQNTRISEKFITDPNTVKATSNVNLSTCSSNYSNILFSQMPKIPPTLIISPFCPSRTVSVIDIKATKSESQLSPPNELKTFHFFLNHHQSPDLFSDFCSVSQSTVLRSRLSELSLPKQPFSQSNLNSAPSLQPIFPHSDFFSASFSPFLASDFVDFSYCPVACDPYISPDV